MQSFEGVPSKLFYALKSHETGVASSLFELFLCFVQISQAGFFQNLFAIDFNSLGANLMHTWSGDRFRNFI